MASAFSIGGLVSGLDSGSIISQLMSIESQPLTRLENRIASLESQQEGVRSLRTQMLSLRSRAQDFRLGTVFNQFTAETSEETVVGVKVSGSNPVLGSYTVNVQQLASATVAASSGRVGATVNPAAPLSTGGINSTIETGTFTVNGITFNVNPATQSLNDMLTQINSSGAGVTATYDAAADKVTIANTVAGNTALINLGGTDDTSNFLAAIGLRNATQYTNGSGSTEAVSTSNLGAINPSKDLGETSFSGGSVTAGTFFVNGISISVDPASDSVSDVLQRISDSDAQVNASYDSTNDTIKLVSKNLGSRTISLTAGTSNFLAVTNLTAAVQTAGNDSKFTVNGGAVITRNTNQVADAIGGLTLDLLSQGTSTLTIAGDDDSIVEKINEFITTFNESVDIIADAVGASGVLKNDGSIQAIAMSIREALYTQVAGVSGDYESILDIGISTGSSFDASGVQHLELDDAKFREALRADRLNVRDLFANSGETGVADAMYTYLDTITRSTGFLNDRAKSNGSIDEQIRGIQDQMDRMEERLAQKEERLRKQFSNLEQMSSGFQQQSSALSVLGSLRF